MDSGLDTLDIAPVGLKDLLYDCIERIKILADKNEKEIIIDFPDDEIEIKTDEEKLQRAVDNIVSNCIRHTKTKIIISFNGRHIDYGRVNIPFTNILFEYNEEAARPAMIDTMKLLLSNALGNVREKYLLMAGQSGSGKSATINQVIANLLHMYSPSQLTLIMIDFKNVEFNMYTGDLLIPHAKIIAGTTDGEYALSIFDYLMAEMNSRKKQFAKYKFQNIEDYNRAILEGKIKEEFIPRILVLVDEFQVMFTEVEDKIVEIIKARIRSLSKLARFCGCHLWFTSQSMKGTMSSDILDQFGLRACLQCSEETSLDVLGNKAAFNELKARGSILTNNKRGNINDNHRYTIPYTSNKYIKEYLPRLINGGKEGKFPGYKHWQADFYDENTKHSIQDLKKAYAIDVINSDERIIVLGERTSYSVNKLPCNIRLLKDQGEHIIIAGLNRDDRFNIMSAMLYNINMTKPKNLTIS